MGAYRTKILGRTKYDIAPGHDYEVRATKRGFSARCPACGKRHRGGVEPGWLSGFRVYYLTCEDLMFAIPIEQIRAVAERTA